MSMRGTAEHSLTIVVSGEQLALLKKLDFPCSQGVLASARPGDEGVELTGSDIADQLEAELAAR